MRRLRPADFPVKRSFSKIANPAFSAFLRQLFFAADRVVVTQSQLAQKRLEAQPLDHRGAQGGEADTKNDQR